MFPNLHAIINTFLNIKSLSQTKFIFDTLNDIPLNIKSEVIGEIVDLMDEDLDIDIRITILKVQNGGIETIDSFEIILLP